jgi:GTPase involved in cell partitioning and DNA repair
MRDETALTDLNVLLFQFAFKLCSVVMYYITVVLFTNLLAVADLPGLIPGSHLNRGLGIQFLKHIERCAALLYLLDLASPEPWTHLEVLQFELSQFSPELLKYPQLVVANKLDLPEAKVIHCTCNTVRASLQSKIVFEDRNTIYQNSKSDVFF